MSARRKILIIDDDADLVELLKCRMEACNFEVLTAMDRDQALELAQRRPDVILLDVIMPTDDEGYSVFADLKLSETTKHIPVIVVTRKTEDREKILKMGAKYFVAKPFDGKDLLEKINSLTKAGAR